MKSYRNNIEDYSCTNPHVSVVIPAYNVVEYISQSIESVLNQSYSNWELIVVDDGSQDGTAEICHKYRNRLIYHRQQNRGVSQARNAGIRIAKAKLVAFLDGDDYWYTDKLEKQIEESEKCEQTDFICTNYHYVNPEGEINGSAFEQNECTAKLLKLRDGNPISLKKAEFPRYFGRLGVPSILGYPTTSLINKDLFLKSGGFDERFAVGEDVHFWFRYIARCRNLVALRTPLAAYRIRQGSATRNTNAHGNEQTVLVYEDLLRTLGREHPALAGALKRQARYSQLNIIYSLLKESRRADAIREGIRTFRFGWDWRIAKVLVSAVVGR
ncbi:MAG: glycosyltransferase [Acidobacteria bacterium]|nr:glycosyltransferase [Acidobacteriota bacterium]